MIYIAGGVVYNPEFGVVVVNQRNNSWSLPKGHVEPGEDTLSAAMREIEEETGIPKGELKLLRTLTTYHRDRTPLNPTDAPEEREITLFLFETNANTLKPIDPENPEARWVEVENVSDILTHQKDKDIFEEIRESAEELQKMRS